MFKIFINFPGVYHNLFEKPTQKWKIHDLSVVPWLKSALCSTPFIYSFPGPGRCDWHAEKTANLLNYVFRCIDKSVVHTQGHESICVEKISYIHIHVYITHSSAYHKKIGLQSFTGPTGHAIRAILRAYVSVWTSSFSSHLLNFLRWTTSVFASSIH